MALYDRLIGLALPRISIHAFFSVMQEFALGNMTGAQAITAFNLDAGEQAEALTLKNVILAEPDSITKRLKALEFEQVLIIAQSQIAPYLTSADVKTRLGV